MFAHKRPKAGRTNVFHFVFNFRETNFLTQWCDRPLCSGEDEALQRPGTQGRELSLSLCFSNMLKPRVYYRSTFVPSPPLTSFHTACKFIPAMQQLSALHVITRRPTFHLEKAVHISKHSKNKVFCFYFCLNSTLGTCEEICGWFSNFRKTGNRRLKININGADSLSVKIGVVRKELQWEIWADSIDNS